MMKSLWQSLGLVFIFLGIAILAGCFCAGRINNAVLGCSLSLILIGLVGYILINKYMGDIKNKS